MNNFQGVYGGADPAADLVRRGVKPVYADARVALGGAAVHTDAATGLVVAGEYIPIGPPVPWEEIARRFVAEGPGAARSISGMFVLAFYNPQDGALTLLRDPVGARTLYHSSDSGVLRFAAQLRPLRRPGHLSLAALRDYLTCAYVPGAQTLWEGVYELRPAEAVTFPGARHTIYWQPEEGPAEASGPMEDYARALRPLLDTAVAGCMPPTDPIGAYLSGGVDSSLVTAIAAKQRGGRNIHTFAIHFGKDLPNELHFSQMVADHCGTTHTVVELPAALILKHLEESIAYLDDPIGDPLTVPNLLLGRAAQKVTGTILNGEGGDPIFGGPKNIPMLLHELYGEATEQDRVDGYFRSYNKCYDDLPRLLTPDVQKRLTTAPPQAELLAPYLRDDAPMRQYLNRLMQINVVHKGADHILTKVSNLTTACGLIGHSPLFATPIVEAGFKIPGTYKLAGTQEKAALKMAVDDLLPAPILTRPKSGMMVPVQRWFKEEMRRYAVGMLTSRSSRIRPYLNQSLVEEWLKYGPMFPPRHGVKIWLVLTLEIWLRANES